MEFDLSAAEGLTPKQIAAMPYAQTLRAAGVKEEDLPMPASDAMNVQRLLVDNPREVAYDGVLAMYRAVY